MNHRLSPATVPTDGGTPLVNTQSLDSTKASGFTTKQSDNVSLVVFPAVITNGTKKLQVNVMLDPCSTGTCVTESASKELDLHGQTQSLIDDIGDMRIRR